ncbi:MAG: FIST N-terminal domain-containing protein [Flammeovirgaceae bacterium]
MKVEQLLWTKKRGWEVIEDRGLKGQAHLLLAFGDRQLLEGMGKLLELRHLYSDADIILCSTSGEIMDIEVHDDSVSAIAILFEKSYHKVARLKIEGYDNSYLVGRDLIAQLPKNDLKHVYLLVDGLNINGNEFSRGVFENLPSEVGISGALAGDGLDLVRTLIGYNRLPETHVCLAIGFYGKHLKVGKGAAGSWEELRQEYVITRSDYHKLYELDNKPAAKIYQEKLGEAFRRFNSSPFSFPLEVWVDDGKTESFVRMVRTVDALQEALLMAGDTPQGFTVRILQTNVDLMLKGAKRACEKAIYQLNGAAADLALVSNCVGRRAILKNRTEEELDIARNTIGSRAIICGFYGYGAITSWQLRRRPFLQHQAFTIVLLSEES